jgi:urea transporter
MKIHPWLVPSISNLIGAVVGVFVAGGYGMVAHRSFGQHAFMNDLVMGIASAHGFDAVSPALIIGAAIGIVVSFIVTHAVEKLWKR